MANEVAKLYASPSPAPVADLVVTDAQEDGPGRLARAALVLVGYLRSDSAKQRDKAADDLVRFIEALENAARAILAAQSGAGTRGEGNG